MTEIYGEQILEKAKQKLGVRTIRYAKKPKSIYEELLTLLSLKAQEQPTTT